MSEEKKMNVMSEENEVEEMELDLDNLEQVSGGANPFAKVGRVQNQQIDDTIKGKI